MVGFRQRVMDGRFENIPQLVQMLLTSEKTNDAGEKLVFMRQEQRQLIEYLMFEQKYMELIESGQTISAIQVL